MTPLVELEELAQHDALYIMQSSLRGHRLARLCRLVAKKKIEAFVTADKPTYNSNEAPLLTLDELAARQQSSKINGCALLCDGPLPEHVQKQIEPLGLHLYDARFTLNLFHPTPYDDHALNDLAFLRLWNLMFQRRGLAAAVRAQNSASYQTKINYDAVMRPPYAYAMQQTAYEAVGLGIKEISVIEFGVAGGNGLLALEEHANALERELPVRFRLFGFDAGKGLPQPEDYRDQPYMFQPGDYPMNEEALRKRLSRADLIIGPLKETARTFWQKFDAPPVGAIMFDLDYYSSTMDAFEIMTAAEAKRMPRITCYFDDLSWSRFVHNNVGEARAIADFNESHPDLKIVQSLNLDHMRIQPAPWNQQMFILHDFKHALYNRPLRQDNEIMRLDLLG